MDMNELVASDPVAHPLAGTPEHEIDPQLLMHILQVASQGQGDPSMGGDPAMMGHQGPPMGGPMGGGMMGANPSGDPMMPPDMAMEHQPDMELLRQLVTEGSEASGGPLQAGPVTLPKVLPEDLEAAAQAAAAQGGEQGGPGGPSAGGPPLGGGPAGGAPPFGGKPKDKGESDAESDEESEGGEEGGAPFGKKSPSSKGKDKDDDKDDKGEKSEGPPEKKASVHARIQAHAPVLHRQASLKQAGMDFDKKHFKGAPGRPVSDTKVHDIHEALEEHSSDFKRRYGARAGEVMARIAIKGGRTHPNQRKEDYPRKEAGLGDVLSRGWNAIPEPARAAGLGSLIGATESTAFGEEDRPILERILRGAAVGAGSGLGYYYLAPTHGGGAARAAAAEEGAALSGASKLKSGIQGVPEVPSPTIATQPVASAAPAVAPRPTATPGAATGPAHAAIQAPTAGAKPGPMVAAQQSAQAAQGTAPVQFGPTPQQQQAAMQEQAAAAAQPAQPAAGQGAGVSITIKQPGTQGAGSKPKAPAKPKAKPTAAAAPNPNAVATQPIPQYPGMAPPPAASGA